MTPLLRRLLSRSCIEARSFWVPVGIVFSGPAPRLLSLAASSSTPAVATLAISVLARWRRGVGLLGVSRLAPGHDSRARLMVVTMVVALLLICFFQYGHVAGVPIRSIAWPMMATVARISTATARPRPALTVSSNIVTLVSAITCTIIV